MAGPEDLTKQPPSVPPRTTLDALEAAELRLVAAAPSYAPGPSWTLHHDGTGWVISTLTQRAGDEPQPRLLACGAATEHLVAVLHGRGCELEVAVLPRPEEHVIARVTVARTTTPTESSIALLTALRRRTDRPPGPERRRRLGGLEPDDVARLAEAVRACSCDVVWSAEDAPHGEPRSVLGRMLRGAHRPLATVVTPGDDARDWADAGRAVARLTLQAVALGLEVDVVEHALARAETRAGLRRAWSLPAVPQVQVVVARRYPGPVREGLRAQRRRDADAPGRPGRDEGRR